MKVFVVATLTEFAPSTDSDPTRRLESQLKTQIAPA